jgi:hypothetical protein
MTLINDTHNAHAQYWMWAGGKDHYTDEEIEKFQVAHPDREWAIGICEGCGENVHVGMKGYNEQVHSYIRYGPYFVCSKCILEAVDLPEIEYGGEW